MEESGSASKGPTGPSPSFTDSMRIQASARQIMATVADYLDDGHRIAGTAIAVDVSDLDQIRTLAHFIIVDAESIIEE